MTIAPARTDYSLILDLARSSSAEEETVGSAKTLDEVLIERLVVRTTIAIGLDRATLLNLDAEAWGVSD